MRHYLILEPVGGCSGDMTLAALLDLGAPLDAIGAGLDRLGLGGWSLEVRPSSKCGIGGTRVDVRIEREEHARSWREIRALIEDAGLPAGAASRSIAIFERIALAEAHVHGTTPEQVHFHEVGAVDSIVDVVGVALALDELGIETIHASPPPLGTGITRSQHGPIPVPAPATLEILRGRPVRSAGEGERTTPTGAAILAALSRPGLPSSFVPERVGYGIGHKDFPDAANVLRATLATEGAGEDRLLVMECNLDDASPQILARAIDSALDAGALDAWVAPVTMKKGRPAHLLGVLVPASLREALAATLFRETPTLGLRHHAVERDVLERRFETVETAFGPVRIKIGFAGATVFNAAPEWDDCVAAAARAGVAPRRVREEALAAWMSAR